MQIDLKFDDRFLEALWSGEKTSTIRRSKKGEWDDTFFVEYGDLIMEFVITRVAYIPEMSKQIAENIYLREGFYSSQDLMDYCKERGYTKDLYIHLFRLIHQRRKPKERDRIVTTTVRKKPEPIIPEQLPEEDTVKLKKCPICDIFPKLMDYPDGYVYRCQESHCGELWPTKARAAESWNNLVKFMEDP